MKIKEEIQNQNLNIPYSENVSVLKETVSFSGKCAANSLDIQPMEGWDGTDEGAFSELTHRRYERFA